MCTHYTIHSLSNWYCIQVHVDIYVGMYGSVWCLFFSMNWICSSNASYHWTSCEVIWMTQGYSCHLIPTILHAELLYLAVYGAYSLPFCPLVVQDPSLVTWFPSLPILLQSWTLNAPMLTNILNQWRRMGLEWTNFSNCGQFSKVINQHSFNHHLQIQVSILMLILPGLPPANGMILFGEKLNHPCFLTHVEHTIVALLQPLGELLRGEICMHQANWGLGFHTT